MARCHFSLASPDRAIEMLLKVEKVDPVNIHAKLLKPKLFTFQKDIESFKESRKNRDWDQAQKSYENCRRTIESRGGVIPKDWLSWEINYCIVKSDWKGAEAKAMYG